MLPAACSPQATTTLSLLADRCVGLRSWAALPFRQADAIAPDAPGALPIGSPFAYRLQVRPQGSGSLRFAPAAGNHLSMDYLKCFKNKLLHIKASYS
jgi:hypothetical protein